MTLEFLSFSALVFVGAVLATGRSRTGVGYLVLLVVVWVYLISARLAGFDIDLLTYASAMRIDPGRMLSPYYLREGAYWLTASWLYKYIGSDIAVFLLFDLYAVVTVLKIRRKLDLPIYFIAVCFTMFTSVFGVQNVLRQFIGSVTLLNGLSTQGRRWPLVLLAGLFHNSMLLFVPLVFVYALPEWGRRPRVFLFLVSALGVIILLPYSAGLKSSAATGADLAPFYIALPILVAVAALAMNRLRIARAYYGIYLTSIYLATLTITATMTLASAQAERVGMISLFLMTPILAWYIERHIKQSWAGRLALLLVLSMPVFYVSGVRALLLT